MTTKTVYVANDGKEFETLAQCELHERIEAEVDGLAGFLANHSELTFDIGGTYAEPTEIARAIHRRYILTDRQKS